MAGERIYQDDRLNKIKEHRTLLRKSLACAVHKRYDLSQELFIRAGEVGEGIVKDNNQFYLQQMFELYYKYYAAFKRVEYSDGAKQSLLQITLFLKRLKMPKAKKTQVLVGILRKYEASGGDVGEIKIKWQKPLSENPVKKEQEKAVEAE